MLTLTILLLGSFIVQAAGRAPRRYGLSETVGFSLFLCLFGLIIVLAPAQLKALFLSHSDDYLLMNARDTSLIGIMAFALLSTLLGVLIVHFLNESGGDNIQHKSAGKISRAENSYRNGKAIATIIIGAIIIAFGSIAKAQSIATEDSKDPVSLAMSNVNKAVASRAMAAERVIAASKPLKESITAGESGARDQAIAKLSEAEKLATENGEIQDSFLITELLYSIDIQRIQLAPEPIQPQLPAASSLSFNFIASHRYRSVSVRYRQYGESLMRILQEENAPPELISVAIIESGLNPLALSPKGARGIWQFMPETARRYGLPVEAMEDQRIHPEHSTRAAARYLLDLYEQFGDWKLALAAYNAGENRIQQIIDRTGIRNFDEVARRGYLPEETRNYVPAVLSIWSRISKSAATKPFGSLRR